MGILLIIVGAVWAFIGLGNIVMMPGWGKEGLENFLAAGIFHNLVYYILPGLVLAGIGLILKKNKPQKSETILSPQTPKPKDSIESRLQQLDDLKGRDIIRPDEYERRRAEMLNEL